ncbi:hypothetical protein PF001_g27751 [Phytophthora fragariae]|uniref:Uncharacterized protein n=1 Tax=Phytophthora fragariae TaxID=53985 RepID=A0A6A4BFD2_9STRA|nr:hypothetical protein PF003_g36747 [Phytophthora fragariae]KAE9272878.1 hypothetical protein PF001_g27751 [Phytophthora fragariae]
MEGEAIRQHMRAKLEQGVTVDGAEPMQDAWQPEYQKEVKMTRDEWQNLWSSQSSLWPESAKAAFPLAGSSEENWTKAASMEPVQLIKAVKRFPFPEEVLAMLSGKIMEKWTAAWRRDCLHGSLLALRSRMEDKRICRWLDDWNEKFGRRPPDNLPPLVDSREDWNKLRSLEYGGDETLRLCEVENKRSLAGHIICALVYGKEISVITGQEQSQETGVLSRLARHLNALRSNENYKSAFENDSNSAEWMAIARFYSSAFQQGPIERDDHY